jgi:thiopeptide-type bacteriocin biosynthesis protein
MLDAASDSGIDAAGWAAEVDRWRAAWQVPRAVHVAVSDQKIRIDLDDAVHLDVLRTELRGRGRLQLTEVITPDDGPGWLRGPDGARTGEVMVQLLRASAEARPTPAAARTRRRPAGAAPHMPGGEWLYAKLYGGPDALREITSGRLGELTDPAGMAWCGVHHWFYLPYRDPDPHLRLRFTGEPARIWSALLPRLHDWTSALHASGLLGRWTVDTYDPEIERFGGPAPLRAAERAFHADSVLALEMLGAGPVDPTDAALSVLDVLRHVATPPRMIELLEAGTPVAARRASSRDGRAQVADGESSAPAGAAPRARTAALVAYLDALERADCSPDQRERIGLTLAHLHCLRLFGTDRAAEHRVLAQLHGGLVLRRERDRHGR